MKNIYAAFVKAQQGFAPALKDKANPAFKGSKYADLTACVEAVIDSLHANGIGLMQRTYADESGVTVETVLVHESGEAMECGKLHVPAAKQDPQGYGSAMTYARRYSLMAACGIAPEDDDGNAAAKARYTVVTHAPDPNTDEVQSLVPVLEQSIEQEKQKRQGVMGAVLNDIHLDENTRISLKKLAARVAPLPSSEAYQIIEDNGLDGDEKLFLWSLLDSKLRSALKREKDIRALQSTKEPA